MLFATSRPESRLPINGNLIISIVLVHFPTKISSYNIMRRATEEEIEAKHSDFSLDRDTSPHREGPHHGVPMK